MRVCTRSITTLHVPGHVCTLHNKGASRNGSKVNVNVTRSSAGQIESNIKMVPVAYTVTYCVLNCVQDLERRVYRY